MPINTGFFVLKIKIRRGALCPPTYACFLGQKFTRLKTCNLCRSDDDRVVCKHDGNE